MGYFKNNRSVNLENLEQAINEDGKRIYSEKLIEGIKNGDFNCLNEISPADRSDREFMEPLLYAVKNEKNTYMVYRYYGKNLQEDLGLLIEVVIDEPEIIEDTPISYNKEFILDVAEINPRVVFYMADTLKNDTEFIEELKELQDKGVDASVALIENPSLASNPEFMKEAIKEDINLLQYAAPSLKNDYKFMKEITEQNYKAVEHVIQNRESFGLEGIKGAKETTRELTVEEYMAIIDEMAQTSEDGRYKKVRDKVQEKGANDPRVVKWITAMVAQNKDNVSEKTFQKVFDNAILTMTKIQKDLTDNGEIKVSKENAHELITPHILNQLREAAIEKGLEITEEQEKLLKEYEEFHREYSKKLSEKKRQENSHLIITPKQIEERTDSARISEINGETQEIREEYIRETQEKEVGREDESVGDEART